MLIDVWPSFPFDGALLEYSSSQAAFTTTWDQNSKRSRFQRLGSGGSSSILGQTS